MQLMTVPEAAEYMKVSKDTVYILVRAQEFPSMKINGNWRISKEHLDIWLLAQMEDKPEHYVGYNNTVYSQLPPSPKGVHRRQKF